MFNKNFCSCYFWMVLCVVNILSSKIFRLLYTPSEYFIYTHKSSICLLKCLSCDIKIFRYMEALFIIFAIHNKHIVIIDELRFSCKRSLFCGSFLFFFLLVIATFCYFECCLCCYTFCFNSGSSQATVHCSIRAPYSLLYCSIYSFHYVTCIVVAIIFNTYTRIL